MAICQLCTNSIRRLRPGASPRKLSSGTYPPYRPSSAETCWICSKFSQWLQSDQYKLIFDQWQREPLEIRFLVVNYVYTRDAQNRVDLRVLNVSLCPPNTDMPRGCFIQVNFLNSEDYLEPSGLDTMPSRSHADNLQLLANWISNCTQNHLQCQKQSREKWFPTRLLHISNGGQSARLILTKENPPLHPYITLSHRWGNFEYDKLTSDTIQQFQTCVVISKLPRVFQDSIALSWDLGIHYLWIDSLCIKQDPDLSDWKIEALLMQKVYSHSVLNLSASHLGPGGNGPLHLPHPWGVFCPTKATMEVDELEKPYWLLDGHIWNDEVEETPLMQRAWVFQERFLAPRVLHFGKRQLAWECNQLTALEMFPAGLPSILLPQSKSGISSALTGDQSQGESANRDFRKAWTFAVGQYSRCDLTEKNDKLIAFSGVAKMVEACTGKEYIAGMWKDNLIYDLGWYRAGTDSEKWPSSSTSHRAPSWSWKSVDGEVFFPSTSETVVRHFATILTYPTLEEVGTSAFQATGQVELECVPLMLNYIKWAGDTIAQFEVAGICITDDAEESGSHLDLEGSKEEVIALTRDRSVLMVPLFATQLAVVAIMVCEEKVSGSYVRVGAAKIEYGRILSQPYAEESEDWMTYGSPSFIVHTTTSLLLQHLLQARNESQRVIRLI